MSQRNRSAVILVAILGAGAASAATAVDTAEIVKIDLPAETARLAPGPNLAVAQACMVCHSVDYIYMQPPLTSDQWRGEVLKMRNVFGAPMLDNDIDAIVTYLMSQNGKQ
jgi:sulfite dehydrogenase (cytochrome) subunit B